MSKVAHLLQMLLTLQYKQVTTASELAEILEVDKKTIYRYIETLSMANIPVNTKKGRYGGFYLDQDFYMKDPNLTEEELEAVLMASQILTEENGFIYEKELKRANTKIKNISLNKNLDLRELKPDIDFKISNIGSLENFEDIIAKINFAMSKGRTVRLSYFAMNKNSAIEKDVDPYTILFRQGAWHLIGYCNLRNEIGIFEISRIKSISITNLAYIKPANFSVKEYFKNSRGTFRGEQTLVKIKFSKNVANFIMETKWHENQKIEKLYDDSIMFSVYVNNLEEIKRWVMGFGMDAEVVDPLTLREEIKDEVLDIYNIYKNNSKF